MIDMRHELVKLAALIDWEVFEREWAGLFPSPVGRPATPTRLVAGLFYLRHAFRLSDDTVVARWAENPYWQHFCGETFVGKSVPRGLLKKLAQVEAGIGGAAQLSMIEKKNSIMAAASFLRFMAMAVSRAWIFMFSSPLRMALASPWSVLAVPCAPSTRQRWRGWIARSSSPHAARLRRAREAWLRGLSRYAPGGMARPGADIVP
jgi:hypothetical protein